jgi:formamidopyrimidine-DNA glycosylase
MIELPEAQVLADQINASLTGKTITSVIAAFSPHKFAWYHGDPEMYERLLVGKVIDSARPYGGLVEIRAENARLVFGDGVTLTYLEPGSNLSRHQLFLGFADGSALYAQVQMYGGLWAFREGDFANPYYQVAQEKVSPLSDSFSWQYFSSLTAEGAKGSVKAFLATQQRIPGLGNGVLQDILFRARLHPKRKVAALTSPELRGLYDSVRATLKEMREQGGRDTEKDLFGRPGGYRTIMSKNNLGAPCPNCGAEIKKEAYLGGSVYYCSQCQTI